VTSQPLQGYLYVPREAPKLSQRARIAGVALIAAGGVLLAMFVKSPVGTLAAWGFPQAWKGGPLLLGASFCTIIGFFLLIQRRFSLAAFMVSGILSAALTSGALAYVRSIRETVSVDTDYKISEKNVQAFIGISRTAVTPEYLSAFAHDAFARGWLPSGIDFDAVTVAFGANASRKNDVLVTLRFEFSPYVHTEVTGARALVQQYSDFVHSRIARKFDMAYLRGGDWLLGMLSEAAQRQILKSNRSPNVNEFNNARTRAELEAVRWLRDRETNPEVRTEIEKILQDVEKSRNQ
jgi:hypothetical protein